MTERITLIFGILFLMGVELQGSAIGGDSASFTPPNVSVLASGGGGLPTLTDTGYISLSVDGSNYNDSQVVDLGNHEVCMLSTVDWQFVNEDSYGRDMESMQMCEVYQSGGNFYLSAAGEVKRWDYDHDARVNCKAVCYD